MARDDGLSIRAIGLPYLAGAFLGFALGALAGLLWGLIRAAMWRPAPNADEWRRHDPNRDLGLSVAAVWKAKSRVLQRLRQELDGLLD